MRPGKLKATGQPAQLAAASAAPAQPPSPSARPSPALSVPPAPPQQPGTPLQRWLFPSNRGTTANKALSYTGYFAGTAVVAGTALLRQAGEPAWRTIWAEDGRVFLSQALSLPFARTLVTPHAGYVQLYARLIAGAAALFPLRDAALFLALTGAFSLGVLSCGVFHMAKGHISSPWLRSVLVASMVLLPVAGGELLDNAVNVPWWLFFACFWALLWQPRSSAGPVLAFSLCALAAASEPLTALLLPLAGARVLAFGMRAPLEGPGSTGQGRGVRAPRCTSGQLRSYAAPAGLLGGLAFQLGTKLANGSGGGAPNTFAPLSAGALARSLATRVGLDLFAGVKGSDWLLDHHPGVAVAAGFVVIFLVAGAGALCPVARARAFALVAVTVALSCFLLEAWARGIANVLATHDVGMAARYQAVPLLLLVSSLMVSAGAWAELRARRPVSPLASEASPQELPFPNDPALHLGPLGRPRPAEARRAGRPSARKAPAPALTAALCAALLAPSWAIDFRDPNGRSGGPTWAAGVESAAAKCRALHVRSLAVPIDPTGWAAVVPCTDLAGLRQRSSGVF